jgi:hypothetical protein
MTARRNVATDLHRGALIWWLLHAAALLLLTLLTWAQGSWFWISGGLLAVSSCVGQAILYRRRGAR